MMMNQQRILVQNRHQQQQVGDLFGLCANVKAIKPAPVQAAANPVFKNLGHQLLQSNAAALDARRALSQKSNKQAVSDNELNRSLDTSASSSASRRSNSNSRRTNVLNRQPLGAHFLSPSRRQAQPAPVQVPTELTPCQKVHRACGHACGGVAHETQCLPCLEPECQRNTRANKDDLCNICFTSELGSDPAVKLGCGHIFHAQCVRDLFRHKWSTLRISFEFLSCPACKSPIKSLKQCPQLDADLNKLLKLKEDILALAKKFKAKGKIDMAPVAEAGSEFYNKPDKYVLAKCAFYECNGCKKPFYGGLVDCERDLQLADSTRKEDLRCTGCAIKQIGGGQFNCKKHGHKHITWKCHLCCSEALFRCGNAYFCEPCHRNPWSTPPNDCGGVNCPLGVPHPPASRDAVKSMYPLGCSLCRMERGGANYLGAQGAVEEVKLDDARPKIDAKVAAQYEYFNPLQD